MTMLSRILHARNPPKSPAERPECLPGCWIDSMLSPNLVEPSVQASANQGNGRARDGSAPAGHAKH